MRKGLISILLTILFLPPITSPIVDSVFNVSQGIREIPDSDQNIEKTGFLRVGGKYFLVDGLPFRMKGFNYCPRNFGGSPMDQWNWNEVEEELALGASLGSNMVRVFIDYGFSTDNPDESKDIFQYYRPTHSYIEAMKKFLEIADRHDLKVIFTLFDYMPGWAFFQSRYYWVPWAYLGELIPHFINDTRIAAWDILNEGDIFPEKFGTDLHIVLWFYSNMSQKIKELDSNHLVTAGFGSIKRAYLSQDFVDFISFHYYEYAANLPYEIRLLKSKIRRDMPIVAEEFGFPSAGNPWADLGTHVIWMGGYLDTILNREKLAGALFWILTDFNTPKTNLTRIKDWEPILDHGTFDCNLQPKPSTPLIKRFFTGQYDDWNRIDFVFDKVSELGDDGRRVAIGFWYLDFLDKAGSLLQRIEFGTIEANQYQGLGWYWNEVWPGGSGQWAGGEEHIATLYILPPAGTHSIRFRIHSYFPNTEVVVYVRGVLTGKINADLAPQDFVVGTEISEIINTIFFRTSTISIKFDLLKKGTIVGINNTLTEQHLVLDEGKPNFLWLVDAHDRWIASTEMESLSYLYRYDGLLTKLLLRWASRDLETTALIEESRDHAALMKLNVTNLNHRLSIRRVFFPFLGGIRGIGEDPINDYMVVPEREGYLIENTTYSLIEKSPGFTYPGTLSMQFLYYYEEDIGGFYMGVHDPESNFKGIELFADSSSTFKLNWYHFSSDIKPGNSLHVEYPIVLIGVRGKSWEDGASIYRGWALKQWYVAKGTVKDRKDIPVWLKQPVLGWHIQSYVTDSSTSKIFLGGEDAFTVPLAVKELKALFPNTEKLLYWSGWMRGGHDRFYPEYYPPRDGYEAFKNAIEESHKAGARIMLYFNGRIVDTSTETFEKNKQYITIDDKGNFHIEKKWDMFDFAVACPATEWWKNTIIDQTTKAVREFNADVIYLDQIPVASPMLDYALTHEHPPGGGNWWWKHLHELLRKLRDEIRKYNPEAAITGESVNEVYIGEMDAFVGGDAWADFTSFYPRGKGIPLFSYVYHGYTLQIHMPPTPGRGWPPPVEPYLNWVTSEALVRGYHIGFGAWFRPSRLDMTEQSHLPLVRPSLNIQRFLAKYLLYGQMVPVFNINTSSQVIRGDWWGDLTSRNPVKLVVSNGVFRANDGSILMLLSNRIGSKVNVSFNLNFKELGLNGSSTDALLFDGQRSKRLVVWDGQNTTLNISGYSNLALFLNAQYLMVDKSYPLSKKVDIGSRQQAGFHLIWKDGQPAKGAMLYINGTAVMVDDDGWARLEATSDKVEMQRWTVTGVNASGITLFVHETEDPSIIWDRIKIVEGGALRNRIDVGSSTIVWFKAIYEYDGTIFDSSKGVLYINGSAASWNEPERRWEISTSLYDEPMERIYVVTGIQDYAYNITVINDAVGPISVVWREVMAPVKEPPIEVMVAIIVAIMTAIILVVWKFGTRRRKVGG